MEEAGEYCGAGWGWTKVHAEGVLCLFAELRPDSPAFVLPHSVRFANVGRRRLGPMEG